MKKYILSPLCSALIMPGLGQVLNQRILKGLMIMGLETVIFIAVTIKLALLVLIEIQTGDIETINNLMEDILLSKDLSALWIMVIVFLVLWIYSIIDALIDGFKIEKGLKEAPDEILSH